MKQPKPFRSLPQRELEILQALWAQSQPVSAAELNAYMEKDWRIQTLITHLARMKEKGVVHIEQRSVTKGARYFYQPTVSQDEYLNLATQEFLHQHYNNDVSLLLDRLMMLGLLPVQGAGSTGESK